MKNMLKILSVILILILISINFSYLRYYFNLNNLNNDDFVIDEEWRI